MALLHSLLLLCALASPAPLGDGYLGVMLANATRPTVAEVLPNSPADKAGIKPGDVFVSVDGVATGDEVSFAETIRKRNAGERVKLVVQRGKEQVGKAGSPIPEQTIETMKEDMEWAKAQTS